MNPRERSLNKMRSGDRKGQSPHAMATGNKRAAAPIFESIIYTAFGPPLIFRNPPRRLRLLWMTAALIPGHLDPRA